MTKSVMQRMVNALAHFERVAPARIWLTETDMIALTRQCGWDHNDPMERANRLKGIPITLDHFRGGSRIIDHQGHSLHF